jgi:hypothetical protein
MSKITHATFQLVSNPILKTHIRTVTFEHLSGAFTAAELTALIAKRSHSSSLIHSCSDIDRISWSRSERSKVVLWVGWHLWVLRNKFCASRVRKSGTWHFTIFQNSTLDNSTLDRFGFQDFGQTDQQIYFLLLGTLRTVSVSECNFCCWCWFLLTSTLLKRGWCVCVWSCHAESSRLAL